MKKPLPNGRNYMTQLTTRQWRTHDLIVANSQLGKITTQKEICDNYPYDPVERKDGYVWNDNPKSHDHCSAVWHDINAINASDVVHKVIIPDNFTYHVAENEAEVKAFIKGLYLDPAIAKLVRYSNLLKKARRDGQGRLPIEGEESKAKEWFEAFIAQAVEEYPALT